MLSTDNTIRTGTDIMDDKRPQVNLRIPQELLDEAKRLEINISKAARKGIEAAIEREKRMRELEETETRRAE